MPTDAYSGVLCIGDPHLASRVPGFRKDDYPRTILGKLEWCLGYAFEHRLLPVLLGDVFHFPRDNSNALLTDLFRLLRGREVLGVSGNHDCSENALSPDDSLAVLQAAGAVKLLNETELWSGRIGGTDAVIGGTPWGKRLPERFDASPGAMVVWIIHHDVRFSGYEDCATLAPKEIPGVTLIVNGHIHRPLESMVCGATTWLNPGNIARVKRSDASRQRRPGALHLAFSRGAWQANAVEAPHRPFDEVFHDQPQIGEAVPDESVFIRGLEQLEQLRTSGGAGLMAFLEENLAQFDPEVAGEIMMLAKEVCRDGN